MKIAFFILMHTTCIASRKPDNATKPFDLKVLKFT